MHAGGGEGEGLCTETLKSCMRFPWAISKMQF